MIKIIRAKRKHFNTIRRMEIKTKLSLWPKWLYKALLVLTIGYGFIILYKNKPAGFLFAIPLISSVFIHQISILPKYQKKGLGGKLLNKILHNNKKTILITKQKVIPWYLKKGFVKSIIPQVLIYYNHHNLKGILSATKCV